MRLLRGLVLTALASLALASPAAASPDADIGIEDERLLLSEFGDAPPIVDQWVRLGVDVVRLHARWIQHAPGRTSTSKPAGFNASDHRSRGYTWRHLDQAIALVRDRGLKVYLTVTGPGPLWTSRRPQGKVPRSDPDPSRFAHFARAVATRYGAQVDRYLLWNEPNQPGWLEPQWDCGPSGRARSCSAVSPHLYRELARAGIAAVKRADPGAQVYIGELAPVGKSGTTVRAPMRPLKFLRELGCVDDRFRPVRSGRCKRFRPLTADGVGYHPHGVQTPPDRANPDLDEAQFADVERLFSTLDRLSAKRRLIATSGRFDVHMTEFGYQTSPPDHVLGVTVQEQARYNQQAAYITWRHPRIKALIHYQWRDEPVFERGDGRLAYAGWQSGLLYINNRPKPALGVFPQPFVIDTAAGLTRARLWGQVRPGGRHEVRLERRLPGAAWESIATVVTDDHGYWVYPSAVSTEAEYRYVWGAPIVSSYEQGSRFSGVVSGAGRGRSKLGTGVGPR